MFLSDREACGAYRRNGLRRFKVRRVSGSRERKHLENIHAEERELWKTEHAKDQEEVSQAIQKAIQEQRKISQVSKISSL